MTMLCKILGHKATGYAGAAYGNVEGGHRDGTNREHYEVTALCDRCGERFELARFHGPLQRGAHANALRSLSPDVSKVVTLMRDDYATFAKRVAQDTGLDEKRVREIWRALKALGLAYHMPTWDEDIGVPSGSGYFLTAAGEKFRDGLEALK